MYWLICSWNLIFFKACTFCGIKYREQGILWKIPHSEAALFGSQKPINSGKKAMRNPPQWLKIPRYALLPASLWFLWQHRYLRTPHLCLIHRTSPEAAPELCIWKCKETDTWIPNINQTKNNKDKAKFETLCPHLKRVSVDLEGPAKTNLLLVLWVRKGLIILFTARYHHGTLMKTWTKTKARI